MALPILWVPAAVAEDAVEVRRLERSFFAGNIEKFEIDVTLASLSVVGIADGRDAEVEVILSCRRRNDAKCQKRAQRIRLAPRLKGSKIAMRLKGTSRAQAGGIEAHMKVRLPERLALEIDMAGGDVVVQNMLNNVEIDSAGGNIEFFGSQDRIAYFKVDVGFGNGDLWLRDSKIEASGWPRSIDWKGNGQAKVEIDLGGGTIKARLD